MEAISRVVVMGGGTNLGRMGMKRVRGGSPPDKWFRRFDQLESAILDALDEKDKRIAELEREIEERGLPVVRGSHET